MEKAHTKTNNVAKIQVHKEEIQWQETSIKLSNQILAHEERINNIKIKLSKHGDFLKMGIHDITIRTKNVILPSAVESSSVAEHVRNPKYSS